ncbi:hypothetical protein M8C21_017622 [Ambrosia artemisiifolia]|uniref:Uncharacterized protein n=1 Tax=Ambrosia artemisiifolia TaxID=4212 RepID=A0AAD5D6B4_AMBAR|nr:hypothetical protein M8C21_017622 [Ambrosia artemisiifolia]
MSNIHFHKPGTTDIIRVDARPSDAINVAQQCRVTKPLNNMLYVYLLKKI